jgi:hypothetical protein
VTFFKATLHSWLAQEGHDGSATEHNSEDQASEPKGSYFMRKTSSGPRKAEMFFPVFLKVR